VGLKTIPVLGKSRPTRLGFFLQINKTQLPESMFSASHQGKQMFSVTRESMDSKDLAKTKENNGFL